MSVPTWTCSTNWLRRIWSVYRHFACALKSSHNCVVCLLRQDLHVSDVVQSDDWLSSSSSRVTLWTSSKALWKVQNLENYQRPWVCLWVRCRARVYIRSKFPAHKKRLFCGVKLDRFVANDSDSVRRLNLQFNFGSCVWSDMGMAMSFTWVRYH